MTEIEKLRTCAAVDGRDYNEIWTIVEDKDILNKIKYALVGTEDNKFEIDYVAKAVPEECAPGDEYENIVIHLWAGKNGPGKWNEYFTDAISIINRLTSKEIICKYWPSKDTPVDEYINVGKMFDSAWLMKWENDCPDDVSDLYIGVR